MRDSKPFEAVKFAENPEPRVPWILVVDTSRSMSDSAMQQLHELVDQCRSEILSDALTAKRVELALVTFGRDTTVARNFTAAGQFQPPHFISDGDAQADVAIHLAIELLCERKSFYKTNDIVYERPCLFLVSAGTSADHWDDLAQLIHNAEKQNQFVLHTITAGNVDLGSLKKLSSRTQPRPLTDYSFRELLHGPSGSPSVKSRPGKPPSIRDAANITGSTRWRYLANSVMGTSHVLTGKPCQDFHLIRNYSVHGDDYLIVACSDGAGSVSHAELGSRTACEAVVDQVCQFLDTEHSLAPADRNIAMTWLKTIRERLVVEAHRHDVELRQLSCTLLLAIIGKDQSLFVQVGDGAMVTLDNATDDRHLRPVFWPQNREYANMTYFVTDPKLEEVALFERRETSPDAIAAFTDGMQQLALDNAAKAAHKPFFAPFFGELRKATDSKNLSLPFRQFLNSKKVNERTDDDKTLVIAMRDTDSR